MKIRLSLICAFIALFAFVAFAADVSGKWTSEQQGRDGNTVTITWTLKQDGEKLSGTMAGGRGGDVQISDGKVSGNDVSFKVVRETPNGNFTTKYTGTVSGTEMKLKLEREGGGGGGGKGGGKGGPSEITLKKSTT
jgi:hypothetical protein